MISFFATHCCRAIEVKRDTWVMCGLRIGHDGECKPAQAKTDHQVENSRKRPA